MVAAGRSGGGPGEEELGRADGLQPLLACAILDRPKAFFSSVLLAGEEDAKIGRW